MRRLGLFLATIALLAGCSQSYVPPRVRPTGEAAAPLGRVFDLSVSLPDLEIPELSARGAVLSVTIETDAVGEGRHEARVTHGPARVAGSEVPVEEISSGTVQLVESAGAWLISRLGPVRIAGTAFEYQLDGASPDGWSVAGTSRESQTGGEGTFSGARRHRFAIGGSDFVAAGQVSILEVLPGGALRVRAGVTEVSSDPRLRVTGDALFAINGFSFDNLQRLDPAAGFATAWQAGTAPGSNPRDVIVVAEDKGYVSRYEPPFDDLLVIEPRGGARRGAIDLGELAENPDGTPRPDRIARAGDAVFVALQDIDRTFTRYGDAKLAVVDPGTDRVERAVVLPGKNPVALWPLKGADGRDRLFVALAGIYPGLLPQELSGGVAVVDVANRAFERWALDDDDAGGNVSALAMVGERLGYVLASDPAYVTRLLAFDPESGGIRREVFRTTEYAGGIAIDSGGILALAEASFFAPRVCLWQAAADPAEPETSLGCVPVPLPPVAIEALD